MGNVVDYKHFPEQSVAPQDFVRAEIKASGTRVIQWLIGTAPALTHAFPGIRNLVCFHDIDAGIPLHAGMMRPQRSGTDSRSFWRFPYLSD